MIKVNGLCKNFGANQALKNLTFNFDAHKIIGIVGSDGSGKTTLLRLFASLMSPSSGAIEILGFNMPNYSEDYLSSIGYMPQNFGLYEQLSCYENLKLYASLKGISNEEEKIKEVLNFMRLYEFKDRFAGDLSGGMKQKLTLCVCLLKNPKILFLDEPGVGVDPVARMEFFDLALGLKESGISIIWATSYQDEAEKFDEILLLSHGEILVQNSPKNAKKILQNRVFSTPKNDEVFQKLRYDEKISQVYYFGNRLKFILKKENELPDLNDFKIEEPDFEDLFLALSKDESKKNAKIKKVQNFKSEELIKVCGLCKSFGDFKAVDDINFDVKSGEIFGLLGPNGAGKSTTFKMLCGLLKPTSGETFVMGKNLNRNPQIKRQIGYMAQKFSLYNDLKVIDNLDFFAGIYELDKNEKKNRVDELCENFGITQFLNFKVKDLSLGIKQRLALICAVLHKPKVLFLDEPTSGVDSITRRDFWEFINEIVKDGSCVMITTHLMDEAEFCDKIMLISQGKSAIFATPEKIKQVTKTDNLQDAFIKLVQKR